MKSNFWMTSFAKRMMRFAGDLCSDISSIFRYVSRQAGFD